MKKTIFIAGVLAFALLGCRNDKRRFEVSNSPFIIDTHTGDVWYYDIDSIHSPYRSKESNWIYLGNPTLKK